MANRRKFIAGLGALASGSAAAVGTGAFTSVTADRTLSIDTAGDANAFLGINRAKENGDVTPNAKEYVDKDANGVVSIDFTDSDSTGGSASGVNRNAKTIFDNLLDITNNGSQEVKVYPDSDLIADQGGSLGVYAEYTQGDSSDNTGFSKSDPDTIAPGESITNIGVYIPKGKSTSDLSGGTITFVAEQTANGGNQD
jgi:hypothetical protein